MSKLVYPVAIALGPRTLVAQTCYQCGKLKGGDEYGRRARLPGGPAYVDRRCTRCRWRNMETNNGR